MASGELLTIGQVARRVGLGAAAIRHYEQIGLAGAPARAGGQRRYTAPLVARLQLIRTARQSGFTLREIRELLDGHPSGTPPAARWQRLARAKLPQVERLIARATKLKSLLEAGAQCACTDLAQCFGVQTAATCDP